MTMRMSLQHRLSVTSGLRRLCCAILLWAVTGSVVESAEIDTITPRHLALKNAVDKLNAIFNQRLAEGVDKANRKDTGQFCDEGTLYVELRKSVFQSYSAYWGLTGYGLDLQLRELLKDYSYSLSLQDSIYRDLDYLEAFSLNLKELSDLVSADGHLIGLDKVGHFFAEGWQYFELTRGAGAELGPALSWGHEQEQGKFGYATTGIYSFADLAANFDGWIFWNKILLRANDPLKGWLGNFRNGPYVTCRLQLWESIRQQQIVRAWSYRAAFDLSDYLSGGWDERNNCNSYQNPVIEEKVASRIQRVAPDFSCPLDKSACVAAKKKYGDYARYLLHPACLSAR